jgi:hypothetical protein
MYRMNERPDKTVRMIWANERPSSDVGRHLRQTHFPRFGGSAQEGYGESRPKDLTSGV